MLASVIVLSLKAAIISAAVPVIVPALEASKVPLLFADATADKVADATLPVSLITIASAPRPVNPSVAA